MAPRRHFTALVLPAATALAAAALLGCNGASPAAAAKARAEAPTLDSGTVLVGAGDVAGCDRTYQDEATAVLVAGIGGTVFNLGDNAYPRGSTSDFTCYDASWGRFKSRTRPAPGNHEYQTAGAAPYYGYFGRLAGPLGKGYYSYDVGGWHVVSLNSEEDLAGQTTWLKRDLAAHPARCTLAYWHKPFFTSGSPHPPEQAMRPIYQVLYDAGADLVLSGHNHQYERFAPQDPGGRADPARGLRYFVVGTGGAPNLYGFGTPMPNSEVRYNGGHGVLKLTLFADRYDWEFVSVAGKSFSDKGSQVCH
jgi:acid phosphatase type 7